MRYKVLVTSRSFASTSRVPLDILSANNCEIIVPEGKPPYNETQMMELIQDVDGAIVSADCLNDKVLERANRLKVISKHGVGIDNIDMETAAKKGIIVRNAPGTNDDSVAEYTIALMFALMRNVPFADKSLRQNKWDKFIGHMVSNKTIGIIGLGRIGQNIAQICCSLGMKVVYTDPSRFELEEQLGIEYVTFSQLLESADVISVNCPLVPETYHLIGSNELKKMKKSAYLINTARGEIIDEQALFQALSIEQIAGAALDVFCVEPAIDNPLAKLDNIILTPHIAASTVESVTKMSVTAAQNLVDSLKNHDQAGSLV